MRRPLLTGFLAVALVSLAPFQSAPSDDAPSPMEVISALSQQPRATGIPPHRAAQDLPEAKAGAARKPGADKPNAAKASKTAAKAADPDADFLGQCLRDWDAGTHMTRQEWARTCRRLATNRLKFLRAQEAN